MALPTVAYGIIASFLPPEEKYTKLLLAKQVSVGEGYKHFDGNGFSYKNGVLHSYDDYPACYTVHTDPEEFVFDLLCYQEIIYPAVILDNLVYFEFGGEKTAPIIFELILDHTSIWTSQITDHISDILSSLPICEKYGWKISCYNNSYENKLLFSISRKNVKSPCPTDVLEDPRIKCVPLDSKEVSCHTIITSCMIETGDPDEKLFDDFINRRPINFMRYPSYKFLWYKNGLLHRDGEPAIRHRNSYKEYWTNGRRRKKSPFCTHPCFQGYVITEGVDTFWYRWSGTSNTDYFLNKDPVKHGIKVDVER